MPTNTLTDARCRTAKPAAKPVKMADGQGMYLFVSPTGAKSWRMAYRMGGKARTITFGLYPEVGLAEARQRRDDARKCLRDGLDPMEPRRIKQSMTLTEAFAQYWAGRQDVTERYRVNALNCHKMHFAPWLGDMPITAITREDLMLCLNRMDAAGLHDYVRKARGWLDQVFDWAAEHGECQGNPAATIKPERAFSKSRVQHFAALELSEISGLLQRIDMERDLQSVAACRFMALTWVRTTELRLMRWDEIEGPDLWRLPEGRMKRRRDHLVPLSRQAQAIVERMRLSSRGSPFVFPGDRDIERPMSENAVLYLLHRAGYKGRMTGHGFRTLASTWANEGGYAPDVIERQLAHAPNDRVRDAYNRAEYIDQRRVMLQAWADWLDEQEARAVL